MSENTDFGKQVNGANVSGQTNQGRNIIIGQGNYNEYIKGNYYETNNYNVNSETKQEFPEICKNRKYLTEYLQATTQNLTQKFGFVDFKQDFIDEGQNIRLAARKPKFDISIGFIPMRGEVFFVFSEFEYINFNALISFANQCMSYAKSKVYRSTVGSAFYNLRVPNNMCFAIALVDKIDDATKEAIQKTNTLRDTVDPLWYEIPIVCELNTKQLFFYEKPLNFRDKMTGEIAWKEIRKIIQQALII